MSYNHLHEIDDNPQTNQHLAEIIASIRSNGWIGYPLLADRDNLLNGCHRATACEILGINPKVHKIELSCTWGDDDYTDALLRDLAESKDTQDILLALKALRADGLVDQKSVDIMQAEIDHE